MTKFILPALNLGYSFLRLAGVVQLPYIQLTLIFTKVYCYIKAKWQIFLGLDPNPVLMVTGCQEEFPLY